MTASDASAVRATQAQRIARLAAGTLFVVGLGLALGLVGWWFLGSATKVVAVSPGSRLLGVSRGILIWHSRTCSVWQAQLEGAHAVEPLEPLLHLAECPPDDPRFDGPVVYQLSGQGKVTRNVAGHRRNVLLQRALAYALALDGRYVYVGNCAQRDNCQIERLPAEDDPGDPLLMQAGILALANMDVDQKDLFWVDRGRRKADCYRENVRADGLPGELLCHDPVAPRLMAATKGEPRATERVLVNDFDGRRPLLGAAHVYWLGAGGVHRVAKAGGAHQLLLPTRTLTGFAAEGDEVFFAADAGIYRARDGGEARLFQRTSSPPRGVAIDARDVYWIDGDDNAVVRRRR
jgi:hypothetical protein